MAQAIWVWQQSPAADRPTGYTVFRSGWRLFRLVQHLGLSAEDVRRLDEQQLETIFDCLDRLDAGQRGFIWLQAYELKYRNEGTEIATAVVLTDTLPEEVLYLSALPAHSYDPATRVVTWNLNDLVPYDL